ncbi:MAG: pyridoxamine 5'-phosphate oxidase family protein [Rickettsiales bacterium]|nr:pyridoxamine 5'-phosphate oxidase family protein [Rickettsiales bacterium]
MKKDILKDIEKLVARQSLCCLASVDAQGFPEARAMLAPRVRDGIKTFYLSTNTSSAKVKAFRKNPKACLYFHDGRLFRGAMFKGTAEVCRDGKSRGLVWRDGDEIYYPKGVSDPDYAVLKFTAESVKYYSDFSAREAKLRDT